MTGEMGLKNKQCPDYIKFAWTAVLDSFTTGSFVYPPQI
jgi:hypothetical protein